MSSCRRVLGRLLQIRGPATERQTSVAQSSTGPRDGADCWRWQNKDDSAQGRWWWTGIPSSGTTVFGLAATWMPCRTASLYSIRCRTGN